MSEHHISKKLLCDIKQEGKLMVNHIEVTVRYKLQIGDYLEIIFPKEKRGKQLIPNKMDLKIIYEDEYFLVLDKPSGVPCIPNQRYHDYTLANGIIDYYEHIHLDSTVHFINRLDKETSGLVIISKYRYIHYLFSITPIRRCYYALVEGECPTMTIDQPIYRATSSVKRCIHHLGKKAVTHCLFVEKIGDCSLVKCELETGRTHQIRVHLSSIGHPLVGDSLYDSKYHCKLYLRSYYLEFYHPITHQLLTFKVKK